MTNELAGLWPSVSRVQESYGFVNVLCLKDMKVVQFPALFDCAEDFIRSGDVPTLDMTSPEVEEIIRNTNGAIVISGPMYCQYHILNQYVIGTAHDRRRNDVLEDIEAQKKKLSHYGFVHNLTGPQRKKAEKAVGR